MRFCNLALVLTVAGCLQLVQLAPAMGGECPHIFEEVNLRKADLDAIEKLVASELHRPIATIDVPQPGDKAPARSLVVTVIDKGSCTQGFGTEYLVKKKRQQWRIVRKLEDVGWGVAY
jgi:hypothetical protein